MSGVDELAVFLRAALDEDERLAQAAGHGYEPDDPLISSEESAHIARFNPKRMLYEVQAKRAILAMYEDYTAERRHLAPVIWELAQPYAGQPGWREEWQLSAPA